jgi:poly-gamma-glutamate synthesis protein (capsule biosynthesis protein)
MLGDTYVNYGLGNFHWYHGQQSETGVLQLRVRGGEVVGEEWRPARIPAEGGAPRALSGATGVEAVKDWRGLRGCTGLAPGPGTRQSRDHAGPTGRTEALPAFSSKVRRIGPALRTRMRSSHDPDTCPVPLTDLRLLRLSHVGFDGRAHAGAMVVHADVATDVVGVFTALYRARFPIRRMRLVDAYGGDDNRSMAANNTSGYNCRRVAGQDTFSDHAYGRAVDINPVQNPYVLGDEVLPPAGRRFVNADRTPGAAAAPGVIREGGVVTRAFARLGWSWGGDWTDPDFQHFSAP